VFLVDPNCVYLTFFHVVSHQYFDLPPDNYIYLVTVLPLVNNILAGQILFCPSFVFLLKEENKLTNIAVFVYGFFKSVYSSCDLCDYEF
jgi:hypothetical protein